MDVYDDGWESRLNDPSKNVANVATPADAVQTAFDVPSASALEAQIGGGSQRKTEETFQFDGKPESSGAGLDLYYFY